jgi:hypothetical protein
VGLIFLLIFVKQEQPTLIIGSDRPAMGKRKIKEKKRAKTPSKARLTTRTAIKKISGRAQ